MQSVRLSVEYTPETIHPMHAFVCESPAVDRQLLLEGRIDDGVLTVLFYVEGDPAAYEAALAEMVEGESDAPDRGGRATDGTPATDAVEFDVRPDADGGFFCYVRAPMAAGEAVVEDAFQRETVVTVPPTEFRSDMTMRITIVGPGEDLSGVVADLPDDLGVEVLGVGSADRVVGSPLTERQREALAVAHSVGYYEVPRGSGVEAVADELGCSVSAVSTLLRRAEGRLVSEALTTSV